MREEIQRKMKRKGKKISSHGIEMKIGVGEMAGGKTRVGER